MIQIVYWDDCAGGRKLATYSVIRLEDTERLYKAKCAEKDQGPMKKKTKRVRLLLDARTELTNEELQVKIFPSII